MIRMTASFTVMGDLLDFDEIERLTGLTATERRRAGQPDRYRRPVPVESWTIKVGPELAPDAVDSLSGIELVLDPLWDLLDGPADLIGRYCEAHQLECFFVVTIKLTDGKLPRMVIPAGFACLAHRLGALINFDIYDWLGETF
jgi:hypothetical protein